MTRTHRATVTRLPTKLNAVAGDATLPTSGAPTAPEQPTLPAIVATRIVHSRTTPVRHAFRYRSSSWLVDLDDPPQVPRMLAPFARFRPDDHFPEPTRPEDTLRGRLDAHVAGAGVTPVRGRVVALTSARVAGYVFNPLSVFWCHDVDGSLAYVVAEVHNTYGERHCYIVTTDADGRAEVDKEFYVSPFNDLSGRYRLHFPEPSAAGHVSVEVVLTRPDQEPFTARLTGIAEPATTPRVLAAQLRAPLAPLVVAARIRWHGIRLWARRLPLVARPHHHQHSTVDTVLREESSE